MNIDRAVLAFAGVMILAMNALLPSMGVGVPLILAGRAHRRSGAATPATGPGVPAE